MTKFGLAQSVRRVEDPRLLKGDGRYTDDIVLPGMLHGIVLRSPHAAAKLGAIDTTAAASVAGVKAIYTAADLSADGIGPLPCAAPVQNRDGSDMASPPHLALAEGAVRHVGDPVAFIVADTAAAARDAAELISVDYDIQPSVTDLAHVTDAGAPLVWPDVKQQHRVRLGDRRQGGDRCAVRHGRARHAPDRCEQPRRRRVDGGARRDRRLSTAASGRWTLYANTQGGWLIKNLIGTVFQTEPAKFRVITPDVGGGFGMKAFLYAEHVLTCYAARKLGRPVKWASDRGEAFLADTQGRDNVTLGELAIDKDGKFLALRTRNVANMGAYLSTFAPYIPTLAGGAVLSGVYDFQQIYANVLGVFTHTVPVDAYRGAGRPESNYLLERLVDAAARELSIDRAELRRRNMVPQSAMPHATPVGKTYDTGDFATGAGCGTQANGLRRLRCPTCGGSAARQTARHRPGLLSRSHHGRSHRARGNPLRRGWLCRCVCRHAIDRPGTRDRHISSSRRSVSASTARRSACVRATRTRSRSAAVQADRAASIPRARPFRSRPTL